MEGDGVVLQGEEVGTRWKKESDGEGMGEGKKHETEAKRWVIIKV